MEKIKVGSSKYQSIHLWLKKTYGKANKCMHCATKNASRYEWALIKGKEYDYNINNYIPLCISCHKKYDGVGKYKRSDTTKKKMSESRIGYKQPILKCPHCNKEGALNGMRQWHFDNCKFKEC